ADTVMEGIFIALVLLVLLGAMLVIILWLLAKGKLRSPLILREEQRRDQGYIGSSDLTYLLGKRGVALTDLRPSGAGDFDGVRFDVLSEGEYIEKGSELEIIKVGGSKLIVKQAD
ncbi:MAG: NfeD family protein, partial [Lachnospiraceae bacterium]|nr:NfeD family protein [Lachnospiraceae bacterium]